MLGEWGGCLFSPAPHPRSLRPIDAKWPAPWSDQSPRGPWGVRGALVTTSSRGWVAVIHPPSPGAHSPSFPPLTGASFTPSGTPGPFFGTAGQKVEGSRGGKQGLS